MPPPYVTRVRKSATGELTFTVLIDEFEEKEFIEITGAATQVGGAFAMINQIVPVPEKDSNQATSSVKITVDPNPDRVFRNDLDVTVFIRIAKVWVTVLGQGLDPGVTDHEPAPGQGEGRWGRLRGSSQMYAPKPPEDGA